MKGIILVQWKKVSEKTALSMDQDIIGVICRNTGHKDYNKCISAFETTDFYKSNESYIIKCIYNSIRESQKYIDNLTVGDKVQISNDGEIYNGKILQINNNLQYNIEFNANNNTIIKWFLKNVLFQPEFIL